MLHLDILYSQYYYNIFYYLLPILTYFSVLDVHSFRCSFANMHTQKCSGLSQTSLWNKKKVETCCFNGTAE